MSSLPPHPPHASIEITPDAPVEYVNWVRIAHSATDIVFDFAQLLPGLPQGKLRSRIVMSPLGAKLLFRALADNIAKFEASYGEIHVPGGSTLADHLFRPPQPPEPPAEK
jgi:hypothetical protein